MSAHRIRNERERLPLLLPTRCCHRQDALHEAAPILAIRAVTPLAPQLRRAQRLFLRVVRRLHPRHLHILLQCRPDS